MKLASVGRKPRRGVPPFLQTSGGTASVPPYASYRADSGKVTPVYWRALSLAQGVYALPFACKVAWLSLWLMRRLVRYLDTLLFKPGGAE